MDKNILKQIILENQKEIATRPLFVRHCPMEEQMCYVFVGVRRAGKSYTLYQRIQQLIEVGHSIEEILYLNFEDNRLVDFQNEDFQHILEAYSELYDHKPMLFLDEVQNIVGWEKFARRMADGKYVTYLTGSNAKMLSSEFMTTLGGRFLQKDIYPFSMKEYFDYTKVPYSERDILTTQGRAKVIKAYNEYLVWGGLPESIGQHYKRDYISSTFQKIYLGDVASRNKISNITILRMMIKKIAESVKQPISYNRLSNILSTIGGKVTVPTVVNYIGYCEDAWLLLRLRNIYGVLGEKESICKYYFIDNAVLNLFLLDGETSLLENMIALQLFRIFGHNRENDTVYFYNANGCEVDFYVPAQKWAIQVCYSLSNADTRKREVSALFRIPKMLECERRTIFTYDEEDVINDEYGSIEVVPAWKWLLK